MMISRIILSSLFLAMMSINHQIIANETASDSELVTKGHHKDHKGDRGQTGHRGPTGHHGHTGITGVQGAIGATGAQGAIGPTGTLSFADFYTIFAGGVTGLSGAEIPFVFDDPTQGSDITRLSDSEFAINTTGIYHIRFMATITSPEEQTGGQLVLAVNDTQLPQTIVGTGTQNTQVVGTYILPLNAGDIISVRNPLTNDIVFFLDNPGGNNTVSGHLVIIRLA